jgi:hypothetical protein
VPILLKALFVGASRVKGLLVTEPNALSNPGVFSRLVKVDRFGLLSSADIRDDPALRTFEPPQPITLKAIMVKINNKRTTYFFI